MKTPQQAAKELSDTLSDQFSFIEGVKFAEKWISVEEEIPQVNKYHFTEELLTKRGSLVIIQKGFKNPKNNKFNWCDEEATHWRLISFL